MQPNLKKPNPKLHYFFGRQSWNRSSLKKRSLQQHAGRAASAGVHRWWWGRAKERDRTARQQSPVKVGLGARATGSTTEPRSRRRAAELLQLRSYVPTHHHRAYFSRVIFIPPPLLFLFLEFRVPLRACLGVK